MTLYYPIFAYVDNINNKVTQNEIKEALEHFVSDHCQQEIHVTGFQIIQNWGQAIWKVETSDPKINDLQVDVRDKKVTLYKPERLQCSGDAGSYQLNRTDGRFYPIDLSNLPPSTTKNFETNIWISLFLGGVAIEIMIVYFEQKKMQERFR